MNNKNKNEVSYFDISATAVLKESILFDGSTFRLTFRRTKKIAKYMSKLISENG